LTKQSRLCSSILHLSSFHRTCLLLS
jgi:hypothetical protein